MRLRLIAATVALAYATALFHVSAQTAGQDVPNVDGARLNHVVTGRVQELQPAEPLKLEEINNIPIEIGNYKVESIQVELAYYGTSNEATPLKASVKTPLIHGDDGTTYLQVFPERVGKVLISIVVFFEDGSLESTHLDAEVVQTDQSPIALEVVQWNAFHGTIYISLTGQHRPARLFPLATYKAGFDAVPVAAKDVQFTVITAVPSDPSVRIDARTGDIVALHVGHALIETEYRGLTSLTCVGVTAVPGDGSDRTDCKELLPPGVSLPKSSSFSSPKVQPRIMP